MLGRRWNASLLLAIFCLTAAPIAWALPSGTANASVGDDLTTDYAKQIIRQSKVAEMKGMLDERTAPCDDFYGYACGNWHRQNPAQLFGNIMTDTFQLIVKGFDRRLQRLLQSGEMRSELEQKLQNFYRSCLLADVRDIHYKRALLSIYSEFGGFPVVERESWIAPSFSWWRTIAEIQHKYGQQIILAVDIMSDIKNHTVNRVYLGPPDNKQPISILKNLEDKALAHQLQLYFGVAEQLAKRTARQLIKLQRALAEGSLSENVSLEDDLALYSVAELEQRYAAQFSIKEYLGLVLGKDNVPEHIYIYSENYLNSTLQTLQATPVETIANYVIWQLLEPYRVQSEPNELRTWCTEQTKKHFAKLTDHMIYERYRSPAAEADVKSVWKQIRETFRQQLAGDKLDWIANRTRELAIHKLDRMELHINSYDNVDFQGLYGAVAVDRQNYVLNVQQLLMVEAKRSLKRQHNPATSLEATDVLSFTPAYNILDNNITIPVALLQPRYFWDANYPQALKYGTLGYLLAHEMIHGFDDEGRNYDANGNLAPWWDERSRYEFEEKRKCFQAQYHSYKYGGTRLPESVLQSENIADNAGVKLAYKAYQRWLEQQPPEVLQQETLAGLELTSRQLFFLSYAQLWCDDVQSLFKTSVAKVDDHAPGMYRVIGPLSNFQEFSWVYNCSQQAPMDPEFKCAIY
ncbi:hypothetical protein AWZ03_001248 [Drosophila navojoa]|uniref:Peptidase M13 C-terminal domain-containing protein n=1 Tax=Drosophila navojoa TaxID=7232 RepID=A0A484BUF1_DRONA|nr:neprilysin-4 [Drosophila navojoa]TDG52418.1 hypothetical protein AWZ03_001248 [Drosophila navojoa]